MRNSVRRLATIQLDCPVQFEPEQFRARSPHTDGLPLCCRELEFTTLAKAFQPAAAQDTSIVEDVENLHADARAAGQLFVRSLWMRT